MKRLLGSVVLGVAGLALTAGTAVAGCPTDPGSYPEEEGWRLVDETFTWPAGYACDVAIRMKVYGHERTTVNGQLIPEDYQPKAGDKLVSKSPDEVITLVNTKNQRTIKKVITGSFYDTVTRNGRDINSKGVGKNIFFGEGVKGIIWANGVQRFTVTDFTTENSSLQLNKTKGTTVEMCKRLGAKAVNGKNYVPEA